MRSEGRLPGVLGREEQAKRKEKERERGRQSEIRLRLLAGSRVLIQDGDFIFLLVVVGLEFVIYYVS